MMFALLLGLSVSGCQGPEKRASAPAATHVDELMQTYQELRSGRFVVIADFEDPAQMEIVQFIGVSDEASCVLDARQGRPETGGHCLRFTAGGEDDAVVLKNDAASSWYMKRDWRPYDLLLLSIHTPDPKVGVGLLVSGGPPGQRVVVESEFSLKQGWNLLRFDLAELGERIPLDDVREIRLQPSGVRRPVDLCIDDILLTAYRHDMFGDAQAVDGSLYVQQIGRRWRIGAGGSFELVFSHGQVVELYKLSTDPYRLRNLVQDTVLGPTPVVYAGMDDQGGHVIGDFSAFGKQVVAKQRLLEMSPVRVVVECEWRFVDDPTLPDPLLIERPLHHWTYTIYPTGRVCAAVSCSTGHESWRPAGLGLAVSLAKADEYVTHAHQAGALSSPEPERHLVYAMARARDPEGVLVLFTMGDSRHTPRMIEIIDPESDRLTFIASGSASGEDLQQWDCQIDILPRDQVSAQDAAMYARAYALPSELDIKVGTPATRDWESGGSGFDHGSGSYLIKPEGSLARWTVDGREQPAYAPVFSIFDSDDSEAWVYVDGILLERKARDRFGNLVFQLPDVREHKQAMEVLFRKRSRPLSD